MTLVLMPSTTRAQAEITVCAVSESDDAPVNSAYVQLVQNEESIGLSRADETGCATFDFVPTGYTEQPSLPGDLIVDPPYPNPSSGIVNVALATRQPGFVKSEVFDVMGRRIAGGDRHVSSRNTLVRLDLTGHASGIYFVRFTREGLARTVRIVKGGDNSRAPIDRLAAKTNDTSTGPTVVGSSVRVPAVDSTAILVVADGFYPASTRVVARDDTTILVAMERLEETCPVTAEVFVIVEVMPELIGGLESIQSRIVYTQQAVAAGVEGRVIVQFVVDPEGRVICPQVERGLGAGLDEEALRVIRTATFSPGLQRGEAVYVRMSLPLTFRLP